MSKFVTDCDYCGRIALCFEDEGHGTCCQSCSDEHDIAALEAFEDDGQPDEYTEWQDYMGGDDNWQDYEVDCEPLWDEF
jgi:hypothetical protein